MKVPRSGRLPIGRGALNCALAAAVLLARAAYAGQNIVIDYVGLDVPNPAAESVLQQPATDTGLAGAQLAVADTNTTGRFTGQTFLLKRLSAADPVALAAHVAAEAASGQRLFVTDVPASLLLVLAQAKNALFIDATSPDDELRGASCRANTLHTLPSRAMLADGLMQYLVAKGWTRIMLLAGTGAGDRLYADALRHAAEKFQITIEADREWTFNAASQQADTGHYQVNDEVKKITQGVSYDVLVVADEAGRFGTSLAYRTEQPRPVAGTAGLVPAAWSPVMDEYASTQLQTRFFRTVGRVMTVRDYGAWLAVRAIGEAATRTSSDDAGKIITYLHSDAFALSGYKGPEFSFRAWDGQLRQPVLLADAESLVSISPQNGFLHQVNELDSLGVDQAETLCHLK